jgi:hypothetical protein
MLRRILEVLNMEALALFLIRILEFLFFIGMAGSALVVMWTTVEDFEVFFEDDELPPTSGTGAGTTGDPAKPGNGKVGTKSGIHTAMKA